MIQKSYSLPYCFSEALYHPIAHIQDNRICNSAEWPTYGPTYAFFDFEHREFPWRSRALPQISAYALHTVLQAVASFLYII